MLYQQVEVKHQILINMINMTNIIKVFKKNTFMRQLSFVIIALVMLSFYTCDEGDIISVDLSFNDDFSYCGETDLILYKTLDDPVQSLSVLMENITIEDLLEVDETTNTIEIEKSGTLNYRQYSSNTSLTNLFCNEVPSSQVNIIDDDETDVTVFINTVLTDDDDNDGVSKEIEGTTNDKDEDDILDYLDQDDDGDNVLTIDENPDPNGDGNVSDAQDTDGDGTPDYLDDDDDGDGIKTIDEENDTQDQDPTNDKTDVDNPDVPDYLNANIVSEVTATAYRAHTIHQVYEIIVSLSDVSLSTIYYENLYFGSFDEVSLPEKTRTETPEF